MTATVVTTSAAKSKKKKLHACQGFRSDPKVQYTQHRVSGTRMGQGVLVVTEPHSELNAGLIVVFDPHILPYLTGMTGHSAVGVSQGLSLIRSMEKGHRNLQWPFGAELGNF